ncbi:MAG TPA: hypothetical protein VEB00_05675 [Clostridia bacterium]|nr:hypothetical protein [Clostridia bacterium]
MKHFKLPFMIFVPLLALTMFSISLNKVNAYSYDLKNIKTLSIDTTGDNVEEHIKILADEENKGYIVKIVHGDNKVYELKPDKEFEFLAPYTTFWKLNIIVADINADSVPEIITWGSMTHENPIHIFRWNGTDYGIIFSGFYQGFEFEDITGDDILEFVIENRLYGTGYESIYYQWQDNKYSKIFYEFDGFRGFPIINQLFAILPVTQPYLYTKDVLDNIFTDEWISNKNNLKLLEEFNKDLLNIQIVEYVDAKIEYKNKVPIKETWKFRVNTYRIVDTTVSVKVVAMIVDMKIISSIDGKDIWRIDNIKFVE